MTWKVNLQNLTFPDYEMTIFFITYFLMYGHQMDLFQLKLYYLCILTNQNCPSACPVSIHRNLCQSYSWRHLIKIVKIYTMNNIHQWLLFGVATVGASLWMNTLLCMTFFRKAKSQNINLIVQHWHQTGEKSVWYSFKLLYVWYWLWFGNRSFCLV